MECAKEELEPLLASLANAHFGNKLKAQQKYEALQCQVTVERELSTDTLQAAVARADAADKAHRERQLRLQQQAALLLAAQQEVVSLRAVATVLANKLAAATSKLTTANQRIEQLEKEAQDLPQAKAELAVAQSPLKEKAVLLAKVGEELVELRSQQVAAAA